MRFVVYRMFEKGQALPHDQAAAGAVLGDLRWQEFPYKSGTRVAHLYLPGGDSLLIPALDHPEVTMHKHYLQLVGREIIVVGSGIKNPKTQKFHQEWRCSAPVSDLRLARLQVLEMPMVDWVPAGT